MTSAENHYSPRAVKHFERHVILTAAFSSGRRPFSSYSHLLHRFVLHRHRSLGQQVCTYNRNPHVRVVPAAQRTLHCARTRIVGTASYAHSLLRRRRNSGLLCSVAVLRRRRKRESGYWRRRKIYVTKPMPRISSTRDAPHVDEQIKEIRRRRAFGRSTTTYYYITTMGTRRVRLQYTP